MSTTEREYVREIAFGVGTFVGMLALAFGIGVLVLAMSVGLRSGQSYLPPATRTAVLVVGAVLFVGGALGRLYRERLAPEHQSALATGATIAVLAGIALLVFGAAAQSSSSAPYLTGPRQKLVLFALSYALVAVGLVVLRAAARTVGW